MTIKICPSCRNRYAVPDMLVDVVHQCHNVSNALGEEDVLTFGDWEDFTGSATIEPRPLIVRGIDNTLQGATAFIEDGDTFEAVSPRGKPLGLYRQRKKQMYIKLK